MRKTNNQDITKNKFSQTKKFNNKTMETVEVINPKENVKEFVE